MAALLLALSLAGAPRPAARPVAVLVPGTLNYAVPGGLTDGPDGEDLKRHPYFSRAVVEAVEAAGYEAFVVDGLDPLGTLEGNGDKTAAALRAWYGRRRPAKDAPVTVVGHSAGGLFALRAAAACRELPVVRVVLVGTPLSGSAVADAVFGGTPRRAEELLTEFARALPRVDLRGLRQLTAAGVGRFLASVRLPRGLAVTAVGGSQAPPPSPLQAMDADYLAPLWTLTGRLIGVESDGLVQVESAYAPRQPLLADDDSVVPVRPLRGLHARLDHAEQFLDSRIFAALGFRGASELESRQRALYSAVLERAGGSS